jgi:D-arabinan exo alpha-(1,3)/(1,5)-arabinofuranosidase (non-reducing end)
MDTKVRRFGFGGMILLIGAMVLSATAQGGDSPITTGSLFEEMVDMTTLATFPDPAYRMVQFSSYDHRSRLPGGPDWFANSDGFGGEPIPNFEKVLRDPDADGVGEYLIADVDGPGAIVRLWTAAIDGEIRMYIDGAEKPVFEGSANEFFHRQYDHFPQMKEIDADRFGRTVYQRDASYAPMPFAKHLRVVWTGSVKKIHFYQLQVRLYEKDAAVVSFRPEDIHNYRATIEKVSLTLSDPDEHLVSQSRKDQKLFDASLEPGEAKEVVHLNGPGAVAELNLRLVAKDMNKALRQTVLEITFDEYPWAQVQSPVGDFFGAAPGVNPYVSAPFTVRPDGTMLCRFVMPFERSCTVRLRNEGDQPVSARGSVLPTPYAWDSESMHFRARWRVDHDLIASNQDVQDLPYVLAHGKGVYVGTSAYLMNPAEVPTPYGNWWGEGDEKVFVDDDAVPSLFGTGSEDYFNYSWSSPDIFIFPYCGQPRNDGPGNRGFVTNYRWHILDPIPFRDNLRFYMELYSHERTPGMSYARIGYHYGQPGLTDDFLPIKPADLRTPLLPETWQPAARMGAANSVFFAAEEVLVDAESTRLEAGRLWAGGQQLVWTPKKNGDRVEFKIPIDSAGKKQINVAMALTPQSGAVAFHLDGKPLQLSNRSDAADLYRPYRTLLRRIALMPVELSAGDHTLTLELKGSNDHVSNPKIGVDFFWVQKR